MIQKITLTIGCIAGIIEIAISVKELFDEYKKIELSQKIR